MKKIILMFFILSIFVLAACETDSEYVAPSKVKSVQSNNKETPKAEPTPVVKEEVEAPKPEVKKEPKIQIFKIGDTATDNELEVTVNSVRFTSLIDEQDNQFMIEQAGNGEEYIIVDLTIKNILPDTTQVTSTNWNIDVIDQDGYSYSDGFGISIALKKAFDDGEILPGMKRRGEIGFLVPDDASDLKMIYKFDYGGISAVFDIK